MAYTVVFGLIKKFKGVLHPLNYPPHPWHTVNSLFATFADLHVRKVAKFANLHSYTHAYCSFILPQWSDSHCFWFALCACARALLIWLFWFVHGYDLQVKKIQRVEKSTSKMVAPIPIALQNNVAQMTGDLYVANKELMCGQTYMYMF